MVTVGGSLTDACVQTKEHAETLTAFVLNKDVPLYVIELEVHAYVDGK